MFLLKANMQQRLVCFAIWTSHAISWHQIIISIVFPQGHDTFTIQHNSTGKCLLVQNGALRLGECTPVPAASWKWGSAHRLFNVESSKCLGLEVRSKTVTLSSCTSAEMLKWRCYEDIIHTEYQMKLSALPDGTVTAKREAQDAWKRGGTSEDICQQPYRSMTRLTTFAHLRAHTCFVFRGGVAFWNVWESQVVDVCYCITLCLWARCAGRLSL